MAHLLWLSDEAWATIDPHLPHAKPGVDDRRVISGNLHVLKTGCRWRDVPAAYGPPTTVYNRLNGGRAAAAAGEVPAELSLDIMHVAEVDAEYRNCYFAHGPLPCSRTDPASADEGPAIP